MTIDQRNARLAAALAFAVTAAAASPASAELYRCTSPDGRTVYTDNPAACPDSQKHEPRGAIQTIQPPVTPPPAAARVPPRGSHEQRAEDEQAQKAHWQQKKRMKEEELRALEDRREHLSRFVTACNRGLEIISKDEVGLKHNVPCSRIKREFRENQARQLKIREYLDEGLPDECRRAGCLPGWIR